MRVRIMNNNFRENLEQKIINDISHNTMSELQSQLNRDATLRDANIYDMIDSLKSSSSYKSSGSQRNQFDYGLALNLFMQKFVIENKNEIDNLRAAFIEKQRINLDIKETANPNLYLANDRYYYTFEQDKFIKQTHIIDVTEFGDYTTKEKTSCGEYYILKVYTKNNSIKEISVLNENNIKVNRLSTIVKILNLKKEIVKKIKRIGYCGKSFDTIADILNMFYKPVETGYYSDNKYNFYKWDYKNNRLLRQIREGTTPGAPNISDYEHIDAKTIVRTDYNGAGLSLQFV